MNSTCRSDRSTYDFRLWHRFCRDQDSKFDCSLPTETSALADSTEWNPNPAVNRPDLGDSYFRAFEKHEKQTMEARKSALELAEVESRNTHAFGNAVP